MLLFLGFPGSLVFVFGLEGHTVRLLSAFPALDWSDAFPQFGSFTRENMEALFNTTRGAFSIQLNVKRTQ